MSLFNHRYQKTGLFFAFALSFIYFPLLLGILDMNNFIENRICNLIVFISFSITFITTINYKIILSIKNNNTNFMIKFLILPINLIIMLLMYLLLPFEIDESIFIFGLMFLILPWFFFFLRIMKNHSDSVMLYKLSDLKKIK